VCEIKQNTKDIELAISPQKIPWGSYAEEEKTVGRGRLTPFY
jgi:hypothetical protein